MLGIEYMIFCLKTLVGIRNTANVMYIHPNSNQIEHTFFGVLYNTFFLVIELVLISSKNDTIVYFSYILCFIEM